MLRTKLIDGTEVLVEPEKIHEFRQQYGHLIVSQPSTLERGPTEAELEGLRELLEEDERDRTQGAA